MASRDVLIVGAGPSGLALANVLAELRVGFVIVDKKSGPVRESRAAVVHVRTLELLDKLGLAGTAVGRGVRIGGVELFERGRRVAEFPLAGEGAEGLTPFPYALGLEQYRTEELLVEGLRARGGKVSWSTEVLALRDGDGGTTAIVRGPGGAEEEILARWVVGADGASSPVRHYLGLEFEGETYEQTGLLADVEMDAPAEARLGPGKIRLEPHQGWLRRHPELDGWPLPALWRRPPRLRAKGGERAHLPRGLRLGRSGRDTAVVRRVLLRGREARARGVDLAFPHPQ